MEGFQHCPVGELAFKLGLDPAHVCTHSAYIPYSLAAHLRALRLPFTHTTYSLRRRLITRESSGLLWGSHTTCAHTMARADDSKLTRMHKGEVRSRSSGGRAQVNAQRAAHKCNCGRHRANACLQHVLGYLSHTCACTWAYACTHVLTPA